MKEKMIDIRTLLMVILFQLVVYILAAAKEIQAEYLFMFIVSLIVTTTLIIISNRLKTDPAMTVALVMLIATGGYIQTLLSCNCEIVGTEDVRGYGINLILAAIAFIVTVVVLHRSKGCLFTDRALLIMSVTGILLYLIGLASGRLHGTANWVTIAGHSFQITEFSKILYLFIIGALCEKGVERNAKRILLLWYVNMVCMALVNELGFIIVLTVTTIVLVLVYTTDYRRLLLSIRPWLLLLLLISVLGCLIVFLAAVFNGDVMRLLLSMKVKVQDRFNVFMGIEYSGSSATYAYQSISADDAIYQAGLFGSEKAVDIPIADSDMVFASAVSLTGVIGGLVIILFFAFFFIAGARAAGTSPLGLCMVSAFTIQAIWNIGSVIGIVPLSGLPLGFISAGGTSALTNMVMMGIIFSIAGDGGKEIRRRIRKDRGETDEKEDQDDHPYWNDDNDSLHGDLRGEDGHAPGNIKRCRPGRRKGERPEDRYWDNL